MKYDLIEIENRLLEKYVQEDFKGYDPYDLKGNKAFFFIQKKLGKVGLLISDLVNLNFPMSARKIFGVKKTQNSKGMVLFTLGCCELYKKTKNKNYLNVAKKLVNKIISNRNKQFKNLCFGYPFNWYSEGTKVVKNTPNIVVSSFVGLAFLKLYEITKEKHLLEKSKSIAEFITKDLNKYEDERGICFSYTPLDNKRVHNANMLGAEFLSKLIKVTKDKTYEPHIKKCVSFLLTDINKDYSWNYFDTKQIKNTQIDNYHTAFVLLSLKEILKNIKKTTKEKKILQKAYKFYKENLFEKEIPILSTYKKLPINIHSCASAIICMKKFKDTKFSEEILKYTLENFYSKKKNKFYYQINKTKIIQESKINSKHKFIKKLIFKKIDKTNYFRWNDAWMFYAISTRV